MDIDVALEYKAAPAQGQIEVIDGALIRGRFARGSGIFSQATFSSDTDGPCRMELTIRAANLGPGAQPTLVTIRTPQHPFTFLLRDVNREYPIWIPTSQVAVVPADDARTYDQIEQAVRATDRLTRYQRIDREPEETYENAANQTRTVVSPIWLGISRDVRIFEMGLRQPMLVTDYIHTRFHGNGYFGYGADENYIGRKYGYVMGRGWHCADRTKRQIDEGALPIYRLQRIDEDIRYDLTAFVTLEKSPLTPAHVRGTHFLVADGLSACHAFTEEQKQQYECLRQEEFALDEETVLCCRITATNTAAVPRYAFFKAVHPIFGLYGSPDAHDFDPATGFGRWKDSDRVFAVSRLNGAPLPQPEIAVLVRPGESSVYEFFLPHRPIPVDRAQALARRDPAELLDQCRRFWKDKLRTPGEIRVPEPRVNDMLRAGLLHLDLTAYGREPDGPVACTDGVYGPVSAEVWLNVQYFDSLGLHDLARRCLMFFLEKQHASGFMQNFEGYMLDTGCVLYALGEHYRYTRDDAWVRQIRAKILKACDCLLDWRRRNLREDLRGRGYGLLEGKAADPEDHERIYMVNAYAYAGLARSAQMLATIDPDQSRRLADEARRFKDDIRAAFFESLATGPVIPLGDGSWCPTSAPWAGFRGPTCLFLKANQYWTHGTMTARDDMLGPIHLIARDVIDPREPAGGILLDSINELAFTHNVASSQPYYSQHPLVHLRRGETRRFLKSFYNGFASLADREIYSWWEHYFHVSPHKTHEEAEFLMQARWMLYLEDGQTLTLLAGVPRSWLGEGRRIELRNVASFFGTLSVAVLSRPSAGRIEASITCDPDRRPGRVDIRLPHPEGRKATRADGGVYDGETETVRIENFPGQSEVVLHFPMG